MILLIAFENGIEEFCYRFIHIIYTPLSLDTKKRNAK